MAYRRAWTYHKCQPLRPVLEWRGLALDHVRDISAGPPDPFSPYGVDDRWLSDPLLEAAARAGSAFALMRLLVSHYQLEDEAMARMFAEFEAHNPTLAQAKLAEIALGPEMEEEMLAHAMAAQMLAPLQGVVAEWSWEWTEEAAWVDSWGGRLWFTADQHEDATEEAERIVVRIAEQQGWDATNLDWTRVAAPMELPATRD